MFAQIEEQNEQPKVTITGPQRYNVEQELRVENAELKMQLKMLEMQKNFELEALRNQHNNEKTLGDISASKSIMNNIQDLGAVVKEVAPTLASIFTKKKIYSPEVESVADWVQNIRNIDDEMFNNLLHALNKLQENNRLGENLKRFLGLTTTQQQQ